MGETKFGPPCIKCGHLEHDSRRRGEDKYASFCLLGCGCACVFADTETANLSPKTVKTSELEWLREFERKVRGYKGLDNRASLLVMEVLSVLNARIIALLEAGPDDIELLLHEEIIRRGKSCAVWLTGDPEDADSIGCIADGLKAIDAAIQAGTDRNNELNRLRMETRQ